MLKDSQALIDEINNMDENHHNEDNLEFYHEHNDEGVEKLIEDYD